MTKSCEERTHQWGRAYEPRALARRSGRTNHAARLSAPQPAPHKAINHLGRLAQSFNQPTTKANQIQPNKVRENQINNLKKE